MITLTIKKKWFDMIKSGEKKEEYREIKKYYDTRFKILAGDHKIHEILFRNGYSKSSPIMKCRCYIGIGYGLPEWGAEKGKVYYVLKILSVEEV